MNKSKLRYLAKTYDFERGYIAKSNNAITSKVITHPLFQAAKTVFCYVSMNNEVDTRSIIKYALREGKTVCVPLCELQGKMTPYVIYSLGEMSEGAYGIPEPPIGAPLGENIDLCIVPCVCADKEGYRVGHGGGYYDRFLKDFEGKSMLLCRDVLVHDNVPRKEHDIRCDILITEKQIICAEEEKCEEI